VSNNYPDGITDELLVTLVMANEKLDEYYGITVVENLKENITQALYCYRYDEAEETFYGGSFKPEGEMPTPTDLRFARDHFVKQGDFFQTFEPNELTVDYLEGFFKKIFQPRNLYIQPILNYIMIEGLVAVGNGKVILL